MLGLAEMSDPAVKYRLDKAVEFLDTVMVRQLADKAPGATVRWARRLPRLSDGSCHWRWRRRFRGESESVARSDTAALRTTGYVINAAA
jgi:hypothetical protein